MRKLAAVLWCALALSVHAQLAGNATWSTNRLASDASTTSTTVVDSGWHVPVSASTTYEFEGWIWYSSTVNTATTMGLITDGTGPSIQSVWEATLADTTAVAYGFNVAGTTPTTSCCGSASGDSVVHVIAKIATGTGATYVGINFKSTTGGTASLKAGSIMFFRVQ